MVNETRRAFTDTARIAFEAATAPEVEAAWAAPSTLPGMSVGALAWHLVHAGITVLGPFLDAPAPTGTRAAKAYRFYLGLTRDLDAEVHRGIREQASDAAVPGPAVLAGLEDEVARLCRQVAVEAEDRRVTVTNGLEMALDEFLVTRLVELVVHLDDLASSSASVLPALPDAAGELVIGCLTEVALRRHGAVAVVRAMARADRREPTAFPVF